MSSRREGSGISTILSRIQVLAPLVLVVCIDNASVSLTTVINKITAHKVTRAEWMQNEPNTIFRTKRIVCVVIFWTHTNVRIFATKSFTHKLQSLIENMGDI